MWKPLWDLTFELELWLSVVQTFISTPNTFITFFNVEILETCSFFTKHVQGDCLQDILEVRDRRQIYVQTGMQIISQLGKNHRKYQSGILDYWKALSPFIVVASVFRQTLDPIVKKFNCSKIIT